MIVLNLELNNLFAFENFKINFSYPKKVENSSIKDEFLKDRPNFRYKKVNILLGAMLLERHLLEKQWWQFLIF